MLDGLFYFKSTLKNETKLYSFFVSKKKTSSSFQLESIFP